MGGELAIDVTGMTKRFGKRVVVNAIDLQVPNMLYGTVLRAPVEGSVPDKIDDAEARAIAGVVRVVAASSSGTTTSGSASRWQSTGGNPW